MKMMMMMMKYDQVWKVTIQSSDIITLIAAEQWFPDFLRQMPYNHPGHVLSIPKNIFSLRWFEFPHHSLLSPPLFLKVSQGGSIIYSGNHYCKAFVHSFSLNQCYWNPVMYLCITLLYLHFPLFHNAGCALLWDSVFKTFTSHCHIWVRGERCIHTQTHTLMTTL